jgi:hypothetical protein
MDESAATNDGKPEPIFDQTEGLIMLAEAYPHDAELIKLKLTHCAVPGEPWVFKDYFIRKADAQGLANGLNLILAAPDAQTAWQRIADSIVEDEPNWEDYEWSLKEKSLNGGVEDGHG